MWISIRLNRFDCISLMCCMHFHCLCYHPSVYSCVQSIYAHFAQSESIRKSINPTWYIGFVTTTTGNPRSGRCKKAVHNSHHSHYYHTQTVRTTRGPRCIFGHELITEITFETRRNARNARKSPQFEGSAVDQRCPVAEMHDWSREQSNPSRKQQIIGKLLKRGILCKNMEHTQRRIYTDDFVKYVLTQPQSRPNWWWADWWVTGAWSEFWAGNSMGKWRLHCPNNI